MHMHLLRINDTKEKLCEFDQQSLLEYDFRFWIVGPVGFTISIVIFRQHICACGKIHKSLKISCPILGRKEASFYYIFQWNIRLG